MSKFLNKKEASSYLTNELGISVSTHTLSKYITIGGGPKYFKFGWRVVYTIESLTEWVNKKISNPLKGSFEIVKNNQKIDWGGNDNE